MSGKERKLLFENLGWIIFRRNSKARRLTIRIKHNGEVHVTVPYLVSYRNAFSFVYKKKDWILKVQEKLKKEMTTLEHFDEMTEFFTAKHKVIISRYPGKYILKKTDDKYLSIKVPLSENINSQEIQSKIKTALIETWRNEAKEILVKRTYEFASRYNFPLSDVRIKNMQTRWGSCSNSNAVNLNLHLLRLPGYLQDYVIMHELTHTRFKNHKEEFWNQLDKLSGDARKLSKELKNYKLTF